MVRGNRQQEVASVEVAYRLVGKEHHEHEIDNDRSDGSHALGSAFRRLRDAGCGRLIGTVGLLSAGILGMHHLPAHGHLAAHPKACGGGPERSDTTVGVGFLTTSL